MEKMDTSGTDLVVNIKDITVCYDDLGKGDIPIIFIHGFPFNKSSWQPQLEFLKETHRVIAYDIRGFGKSTGGIEAVSMDLFADDLVDFMSALKIDKSIVCGLSMGGYILLNAVTRFPERFKAIVLSDTQCIADSAEAKEKRAQTSMQIQEGGLKDFAEGFIRNVFCAESLDKRKEIVEKVRSIIISTSPLAITKTLTALAGRREMCSTLNAIAIPALILCGRKDIITPPVQAEALNKNISNSIIHVIEKAGHVSNLEQPDEFNRYLNYFISGLAE